MSVLVPFVVTDDMSGSLDIDPAAMTFAANNIQDNDLQERVTLMQNADSNSMFGYLFPAQESPHSKLHFCMCNPPFYESEEERIQLMQQKQSPSHSVRGDCATSKLE